MALNLAKISLSIVIEKIYIEEKQVGKQLFSVAKT